MSRSVGQLDHSIFTTYIYIWRRLHGQTVAIGAWIRIRWKWNKGRNNICTFLEMFYNFFFLFCKLFERKKSELIGHNCALFENAPFFLNFFFTISGSYKFLDADPHPRIILSILIIAFFLSADPGTCIIWWLRSRCENM